MKEELHIGVDVGSTTVKVAVINPKTGELLYSDYRRHNAKQREIIIDMLENIHRKFKECDFKAAFSGSGAKNICRLMGAFYTQEVISNSIAVKNSFKSANTAIELGGQDAKIIFFSRDKDNNLKVNDMRMNGVCAGGTGAFIDQIAELLQIDIEDFVSYASKGKKVYNISGRCGVFAKTDIQPLFNQGVRKEDIALSSLHSIVKQTIGGLAQGLEIKAPIIFEGGPLTYIPTLQRVFRERLNLRDEDVIVPENSHVLVAYGTALSVLRVHHNHKQDYDKSLSKIKNHSNNDIDSDSVSMPLFRDKEDKEDFFKRHKKKKAMLVKSDEVYIGIDSGSTTTKFVLIDKDNNLVDFFYENNHGEPLKILKDALLKILSKHKGLKVLGVGTTGYGEVLFEKALNADYHTIETVAHARAALDFDKDINFILDIGGQDMKAIYINEGVITGITLNEACSAGCGSFLETFAKSLEISVDEIEAHAFRSKLPSKLGSRCTVFMNSSVITELKNGKTKEDIMAGLCNSIIENVFTKVIRVSNLDELGKKVFVQGGTFKNDAVLKAFENYMGKNALRPPEPELMGAIGAAILTKEHIFKNNIKKSSFIGTMKLKNLSYVHKDNVICRLCSNNCNRTIIEFNTGIKHITGNRCEKGEIIDVKNNLDKIKDIGKNDIDLSLMYYNLLTKDFNSKILAEKKNVVIGIPRVLEFYESLPFWNAFFKSLGYDVKVSPRSSSKIYESGLKYIPSDTVCFPAKLAHGHVEWLVNEKVDRIFMPMMYRVPLENKSSQGNYPCPVLTGYPLVIKENNEPFYRDNIPFDDPIFHWFNKKSRDKQIIYFMKRVYGFDDNVIIKKAIKEGDLATIEFKNILKNKAKKILENLSDDGFALVLAARPYHNDPEISHHLSKYFTRLNIPVIPVEAISGIDEVDIGNTRVETMNVYHSRLYSAALYAARHKKLEFAQIVSFGCGHDAIITDELIRVTKEISNKEILVLKLDETDNPGPLNIRVKSFVETIKKTRKKQGKSLLRNLSEPYKVKFTKKSKAKRTILLPNLSVAFSMLLAGVLRKSGYKIERLPLANKKAIRLGKKYTHNDICYPAQINIGEALFVLKEGIYKPGEVAIGLAKNCESCRAGQYSALMRKALDEAGFSEVPILTTGDKDSKNMHPGFKLGNDMRLRIVWGLSMIDRLEEMARKIRPYEVNSGETDKIFSHYLEKITSDISFSVKKAVKSFEESIREFNEVPIENYGSKKKVFVIGEILMNYHPGANNFVEKYLESHGFEIIMPHFIDFFRLPFLCRREEKARFYAPYSFLENLVHGVTDKFFDIVQKRIEKIYSNFRFYEKRKNVYELSENIKGFIDKTLLNGEGWLIPAEIIEYAGKGVKSFVILQPFGCMPNHITGRGIVKSMKKMFSDIQILSLDYDPDTSEANVENRLQMLIMNA